MVMLKSVEEYRRLQQSRIAKLDRLRKRVPSRIAAYMAAQARLMAPRGPSHSGYPHLVQNIKRKKNVVSVRATNPHTGLPYLHWVNATPGAGLERVTLGFGNKRRKMTYAQTNHTGVPGFWQKSLLKAHAYGKEVIVTSVRDVMKSGF